MSKLRAKGAKSSLQDKSNSKKKASNEPKKERITATSQAIDVTHNINPLTLRMSLTDRNLLSKWVSDIQKKTNRKVTNAKIIRALIAMQDEIDQDQIIDLIKDMN